MKSNCFGVLLCSLSFIILLLNAGCQSSNKEMGLLLSTMDQFESAWAEGDYLKVDSFFAADAKRLHTEPYVWDREMIAQWCVEKATEQVATPKMVEKKDWKDGRNYLEIRIEGNIAYDIFTTSTFKVIHIWEKQKDGSWKIRYDMGILDRPEDGE